MAPKFLSSKRLSFYSRLCIVVLLALWCIILSQRESTSRFSGSRSPDKEEVIAAAETSSQNDKTAVAPPPKIVVRKINEFYPEIDDFLSLVVDGSLELRPREMSAYWKLIRFTESVKNADTLRENAQPIGIESLIANPKKFRGALIKTTLKVHRVVEYTTKDADGNDSELFEIWGSRDYARNWLWVMVVPELPSGHSKESLVGQSANFQGVFFKLQAYHPAKGKSNEPPLLAPFVIGALTASLKQELKPDTLAKEDSLGLIKVIAGVAATGLVCGLFLRRRWAQSKYRVKPQRVSVENLNWLVQESNGAGHGKSQDEN